MKTYLLSWILLLGFGINKPDVSTIEPCSCTENQTLAIDLYEKGDLQTFLTFKANVRLQLVKDRIAILSYYAQHPKVSTKAKAAIMGSIKELKRVERDLQKVSRKIRGATVKSRKQFMEYLLRIQDGSGVALKKSSEILFGSYHAGDAPPLLILQPGPGTCEEGETPPSLDCGGVAQGVNSACLGGIEQKMDCGYYADMGNDGQHQLNQDMAECTTAMENSRAACQRAVESCDNTYDPRSDQYDFWRRASMSCTLKELLDDPLQTQTANGND